MGTISFDRLELHHRYSRSELSHLWGYKGHQALDRGVVTSSGQPYIVLFITRDKQRGYEPYENRIEGGRLYWEGPTDHFAEERMIDADRTGDQIHVFFRERHHTDFTYLGRVTLETVVRKRDAPSHFTFTFG